jgi:hypothetical protein
MAVPMRTMFSVGPRRKWCHATIKDLWEAVFSVGSVPRPYHEDQRDKPASWKLAAEVESSAVGSQLIRELLDTEAATKQRDRTLVSVWQWSVTCSHELYKFSINRLINPKHVYSPSNTWQYVEVKKQVHKLIWNDRRAVYYSSLGTVFRLIICSWNAYHKIYIKYDWFHGRPLILVNNNNAV